MKFDRDKITANVKKATTEDLLERCTILRPGMEPEALAIIEEELHRRGIDEQAIAKHYADTVSPLVHADGLPRTCSLCRRAAVSTGWSWYRLLGFLPVFPRVMYYCPEHAPK